MTDLDLALQDEADARDDARPLDAYLLVLCTETDDYTSPRGRVLGSGRTVAFAYHLGSFDCPAGVRVGCVYFVPTLDPHSEVVLHPFALLPARWQRHVERFRTEEARHYPETVPWARDTA
jgi:hypothetical protein